MFWRSDRCRPEFLPRHASQDGPIVVLEAGVRCVEKLRTRNHDDVDTAQFSESLATPKNFSNQSFSSVSSDRVPQLSGGNHAEPRGWTLTAGHQHGQKAAAYALTGVEDPLEFPSPPEPPGLPELQRRHVGHRPISAARQDDETLRRFRPLARRRLRTCRPFLVLIRTRNPWVFARRRRFGWNVRFMISGPLQRSDKSGETQMIPTPANRVNERPAQKQAAFRGSLWLFPACGTVTSPARP
jgi:hypothetical protein